MQALRISKYTYNYFDLYHMYNLDNQNKDEYLTEAETKVCRLF